MTTRPLLILCCGFALVATTTSGFSLDASADREMAERYHQAALSGDDRAQFYLGALYSAGVGRPQSDAEAVSWISRAAQQGHTQAMLVLSGMLAIGRGAPKDNVSSYKWAYIVAEASRVIDLRNGARQLLSVLEPRMTPDEINQAKLDAQRFRAVTPQSVSPANDSTRNTVPQLQTQPAPASSQQTGTSLSSPPPSAAPEPAPPAARAEKDKDIDIDKWLSKVPPGLRKRYGF